MVKYCCKKMKYYVFVIPKEGNMSKADIDNNKMVYFSPKFREYGIPVKYCGSSYVIIRHCPWCGSALPKSKRKEWFKRLKKLGFESPLDQEIPDDFLTSKWYEDEN